MTSRAAPRARSAAMLALEALGAVVAAVPILSWLVIVASRAAYPADLEWMEGGTLYQAHRLSSGQAVYAAPETGFAAFPYPPMQLFALAALGSVFGLDYATARIHSASWIVVMCAVMFLQIRELAAPGTARRLLSGLAAASALVCFPLVGGWFDLVRVDSMALGLSVLAAWVARVKRLSASRTIAVAGLLTAAVLTKQTTLAFAVWIVVFRLALDRRSGAALAGATAAGLGAAVALLLLHTDGWIGFWVVTVPGRHALIVPRLAEGLWLVIRFAPFVVLVPVAIVWLWRRRAIGAPTALWSGMLLMALPVGLLPFAKAGGAENNLMPIAALSGFVTMVALLDVARAVGPRGARWRAGLMVGAAVFVLARWFDPRPHVPSDEHARNAARLNDYVRSLEGGVLLPNSPFLAVRNGHEGFQIHAMSYHDALASGVAGLGLPSVLRARGPEWALLSGLEHPTLRGWIYQVYRYDSAPPVYVETMTAFRTELTQVLRKRPPLVPRDAKTLFDFEGPLDDWTFDGDAFDVMPSPRGTSQRLTSLHYARGDAAVGRATSPPFVIDRSKISLRVGGGRSSRTRLDLVIAGRGLRTARGVDSSVLIEEVWDVSALHGREARIVAIDEAEGAWGHVVVDDVRAFD